MTLVRKLFAENFGVIKIRRTLNNIFITLTNIDGNVLISKHAGLLKFRGNKKRTPYVAGQVLKALINDIDKLNIHILYYILQINRTVRRNVVRNIIKDFAIFGKIKIFYLELKISRAHNGLRLKKKRRL